VSSGKQSTNFPFDGVAEDMGQAAFVPSSLRARDGSVLRWGKADVPGTAAIVAPGTPAPIAVAVSPVQPGHAVTVEYRVNGGRVRQAIAVPEPRVHNAKTRIFRALLPGQPGGLIEFVPVLRFAGQPISPRLEESADRLHYQVDGGTTQVEAAAPPVSPGAASAGEPCWECDTNFLGSLKAILRREAIGVTPDGLRIDWHVTEGTFVGPAIDAVVLPGATDWMRIRTDGVAIVNVQACLQTRNGTRIYSAYGGVLDLGADGYVRALRDEFPTLPPIVVAPTYATADKQLQWLNRAQCIGVGNVDTRALRVEFDVYVVGVMRIPKHSG
jgi:hypothetical protein